MTPAPNQSFDEIITSSIFTVKSIQEVSKNLETIINSLEERDATDEEIYNIKNECADGSTYLKELQIMIENVRKMNLGQQEAQKVLKLQQTYQSLSRELKTQSQRLKDLSFTLQRMSSLSEITESNASVLMEMVNSQEALDQRDFVNERQKNIEEVTKIVGEIKHMGEMIHSTVKEDGERIDEMLSKQELHKENLETKIIANLNETEQYQDKMIGFCVKFSFIVILLLILIIILLFWKFSNKDGRTVAQNEELVKNDNPVSRILSIMQVIQLHLIKVQQLINNIQMSKLFLLLLLGSALGQAVEFEAVELSEANMNVEKKSKFTKEQKAFYFKLSLNPANILTSGDERLTVVVNGSKSISLTLFETTDKGEANRKNKLIDLDSDEGQLIFLTDSEFFPDSTWDEIKKQGLLFFRVKTDDEDEREISLQFKIGETFSLQMGSTFVTKISPGVTHLEVDQKYSGSSSSSIRKIRFQVSTLEKKNFGKVEGTVKNNLNTFILNHVFDNILGGILDENVVKLCREELCEYQMQLRISDVSQFTIETHLLEEIEDLSIYHLTEYYDRVYQENSTRFYRLPFVSEMEGLNISISLIPVTGHTSLYANPQTKPLDLEKYNFSEKGKLSKRITISWDELVSMKTEKQNFFIAVNSQDSGEYLIKLDAHEAHYRGRLSPGYSEAGFVNDKDVAKYIVSFKPWENQKVNFTLKLQVISGNADLHVKQCKKSTFCDMNNSELKNIDTNTKNNSEFEKTFDVNCKQESCNFLIAVLGHENHGTHFELMVQENKFHYLMLPGHSVSLTMIPEQQKYLKFSYPGQKQETEKLYLQVQPEWGTFTLFLDTGESFPNDDKNAFEYTFESDKHGLLDSNKNFEISEILGSVRGLVYVGISSKTSCKMDLKFFSKTPDSIQLHTLIAGKLQNGVITNLKDLHYYHIQLSLSDNKAQSVSIDLVPLKGKFIMVVSREGRIPTLEQNDKISYDNKIELQYQVYDKHNEYIVGVFPKTDLIDEETDINFSYKIGLSYSEKTNKLQPGTFMTHTMNDKNIYLIQIISEMKDLLIVKTIIDGYNIQLCGVFAKNATEDYAECTFESNDMQMGYYLTKEEIDSNCQKFLSAGENCFLSLHISGTLDQIYSIGFTYNDLPFHLTQNTVITGPNILKQNSRINFIFHPEPNKDCTFYFNSKGSKMNILSKLVDGNQFTTSQIPFPSIGTQDYDNIQTQGYISVINYLKSEILLKGNNPEILISLIPQDQNFKDGNKTFDLINGFVLQQYEDSIELIRTSIYNDHMFEQEEKYYYFYNNGSSGEINIYVNSNTAAFFVVAISRGKGIRPEIDSRPLKNQKGVNQVILHLSKDDLEDSDKNIKGYFTISVKCQNRAYMSIYWNNKPEHNFTELNLNFPQTMHLLPFKTLYFTFYVSDIAQVKRKEKRQDITLFFKTDGEVTIYLKKVEDNDLVIPDDYNKDYVGNLGLKGGIGYIKIPAQDDKYCTNCTFVGSVSSTLEGQITMLANVEHDNLPIQLSSGFTFPDTLLSHQGKTYRYLNMSSNPFYINVSMLSGFCNVFVDSKPEVNPNSAKEYFFLTQNNQTHSYLKIDPSKYEDKANFYIRVENPKLDPVSYTLSVFENNFHAPIEIGITKQVEVSPTDQVDLFFMQQKDEREFEIRFIIKNVSADDSEENEKVLFEKIGELFNVGHILNGGFQELLQKQQIVEENRVYLTFQSQTSISTKFNVRIVNPLSFGFQVQIDVLAGQYKLLNLNDIFVDSIERTATQTYEAYGHAHRFWFLELKMCFGETSVEFYEDYQSMQKKKNPLQTKVVSENNTYVYYMSLEKMKIYMNISNKNSPKSTYRVMAYNEQDLNDSPYQEVIAQNDGQVKIDTANNQVYFEPLSIKNFNDDSYDHKVTYTVYVSPEFKIMRYAKNCGRHLIEKAWENPELYSSKAVFRFSGSKEFNTAPKVYITLPQLDKTKKYYGVVIAEIHLLTRGEGMIEPLRQSMTYYDEFIVVGGKAEIPINLWLSIIVVVGLLGMFWIFIKDYVFGDIKRFQDIREDLRNITESNIDVFDILESEYKESEPTPKVKPVKKETGKEVEMKHKDDMKAPLDIE